MDKVIIGIHGLANKPERSLHKDDWIRSIKEGIENFKKGANVNFVFEDVYWANHLYKYPLHSDDNYSFDQLYDEEPYFEALPGAIKEYKDGWLDSARGTFQNLADSVFDFGKKSNFADDVAGLLVSKTLKDLDFYYRKDKKIPVSGGINKLAKDVLKDELKKVIIENKDKEITIIAHSMGSIIAYDVLRDMYSEHDSINLNHFITIGSPLGIPYVKSRIESERSDKKVRTPSIIKKSWKNFADKKDPVAFDTNLADDYKENYLGIRVEDDLVSNDYVSCITKKENHHKIFGYLRTPEMARHLIDILKN